MFSIVLIFCICVITNEPSFSQENKEEVKELAIKVAGTTGSTVEKTQRLVDWINNNFE